MRHRAFAVASVAAAGLVSLLSSSTPAAQTGTPPDISGVWIAGFVPRLSASPPMLPAAQALMKNRKPEDDPMARCLPPGVPRLGSTAFPIEIVPTRTHIAILYEYDHYVRRVFTDGRKHPVDPDPSWLGHSIGHWEGRTLVVDTVGQNGLSWLDEAGHPTSESLHVIERFTPSADGTTLAHEITIDDPTLYSATWKSNKTYRRRAGLQIMEFVCETR